MGRRPDIFVINLDRSPDRLAFMTSQFERLGLDFIRLSATDATLVGDAEFARFADTYMRPISRSEYACFHSHMRAWQHCVDTGRPVLVLEDDVILSDRLPAWLDEAGDAAGSDIVNIETRGAKKWVSRQPFSVASKSGVALYRLHVDRGGSGGYLIRPPAARALLKKAERHAAPSDAFLNLSGLPRLQTEPGLASPLFEEKEQAPAFRGAFASTITQPTKLSRLELIVRRPQFKLRRLAGHIAMTARKLRTTGTGVKRVIAVCPSILEEASKLSVATEAGGKRGKQSPGDGPLSAPAVRPQLGAR